MKKYIYILCTMLAAAFTSCNNNDLVPETDGTAQQVTLQVTPDQGLNTRAVASGVNRFAIEVYTDATYATAANVFDGGKSTATSTNGSFTMTLDKNQEYHCLLWADKDGSAVYDLTSLKAVTLQSGKAPVEAWQGKLDIAKGTNGTLTATLTRSVAKITLLETGKLEAGTLTMTFKQKTVFNVSTGATTTESDRSESIDVTAIETANSEGSKINASDIFVLASTTEAEQAMLTFQMGSETETNSVSNVPLKANFNTNIKGHYSKVNESTFTIICDNDWAGNKDAIVTPPTLPDPAIGDFYLSDGTVVSCTAELTDEQKNKCIGIVFVVHPGHNCTIYQKDGVTPMSANNGYVLALSDAVIGECMWASENVKIGTDTHTALDGYANTQSIINYVKNNGKNLQNDYPATYHATTGYENAHPAPDISSGWFFLSDKEGQTWYKNREKILASIKKVTGDEDYVWSDGYWNSSENYDNPAGWVCATRFDNGGVPDPTEKNGSLYVRPILAF